MAGYFSSCHRANGTKRYQVTHIRRHWARFTYHLTLTKWILMLVTLVKVDSPIDWGRYNVSHIRCTWYGWEMPLVEWVGDVKCALGFDNNNNNTKISHIQSIVPHSRVATLQQEFSSVAHAFTAVVVVVSTASYCVCDRIFFLSSESDW